MVMNSGQGPGGSPVPRVLMIADFFLDLIRKRKVSSSREGNDDIVGGGGRKEKHTYCSYYMWKFVVFHSSLL